MILNIIFWLLLVLLTVLFGYLVIRAWRSRNGLVKWGGGILAALLTLLMALITVATAMGLYQFYASRGSAVSTFKSSGHPSRSRAASTLPTPCALPVTRLTINCLSSAGAILQRTHLCRLGISFPST